MAAPTGSTRLTINTTPSRTAIVRNRTAAASCSIRAVGACPRKRLAVPTIQAMFARPSSPPAASPVITRGWPMATIAAATRPRNPSKITDVISSNRRSSPTPTHLLHEPPHDTVTAPQNPEQQPHQEEPGRSVKGPVGEVAETQPDQHRGGELEANAGLETEGRQHAGFLPLIRRGHHCLPELGLNRSKLISRGIRDAIGRAPEPNSSAADSPEATHDDDA